MLKQVSLLCLLFIADKAIYFYKLKIPLTRLQKAVERKFPIEKSKYFLTVSLTSPTIKLNAAKNRIGIEFIIVIKAPINIIARWHGLIDGCLTYNRRQGAFYFSQLKFHADRDEQGLDKYNTLVLSIVETVLDNLLAVTPIYELREESLKHALARLLFKEVTVQKDGLIVRFSLY